MVLLLIPASVRDFCYKLSDASGVRKDGSFLPPGITRAKDGETPMERTIKAAREEAEEVMFTSVRELLKDNGLTARDVDVLVVNCSLFNPTPSLAAMLINHFKMRSDIITYNLGGMGCSAGLLSISLVNELLQVVSGRAQTNTHTHSRTQAHAHTRPYAPLPWVRHPQ